ncbi:MAG: hypothetical protein H0X36_13720 [Sphingomonadaceae bacterium]|nr:hypothetical protein [Sphingomonadaceae bacterium]
MDLGFARRRSAAFAPRTPELARLLGDAAARQACSPTAQAQARIDHAGVTDSAADPRVALFADGDAVRQGARFSAMLNGRQPC